DVVAVEAGGFELVHGGVEVADRLFEIFEALVDEAVGADFLGDLFGASAGGNKLGLAGHVYAIDVGEAHGGCGGGEVDLVGAGCAGHVDDLAAGGAAHDGVVDKQHVFTAKLHVDGA